MAVSTQSGMGSRKFDNGIGFRVWAPNAKGVSVAGDFNNWNPSAHPLTSEGNGYWSTDVLGATMGQKYKYVIDNGYVSWKNDPYARVLADNAQNTVIHDPDFNWEDDNYSIAPWNELVIYELHIGTFSSSNGAGKFDDVINKLGYLQDLGINAIEIMAVGEFNTDRSWGYNPAYIHAIEENYGGIESFKRLVKEAHRHQIAVIFDVVYNHLGYDRLDLWQFDGWNENGKGGIYFYNDHRSSTPWGDTRPDYGRGEVRQYIRDCALMWLIKRHVDGLRWDATRFIHTIDGDRNNGRIIYEGWSLMQWINNETKFFQPGRISIAEDMHVNANITRDTSNGGAGFDSQWDPLFVNAIRETIIPPSDEDRNMNRAVDGISFRYDGNAFSRVIYTESHDEVGGEKKRVPEAIYPGKADSWFSRKRSIIGAVLLFTSPGIPMIFQGQEFLEYSSFNDSVSLDWNKLNEFDAIRNTYKDLIRLRRNWYNNTRGLRGQSLNTFHVNHSNKVICYHRWENGGDGDDVIIVVNFSGNSLYNYQIGLPRAGLWKLRFNSDWNGYGNDFANHPSFDMEAEHNGRDGMAFTGNLSIGAYTGLIYSQG
jgi:1,4-alpha-glucan branching enzyme